MTGKESIPFYVIFAFFVVNPLCHKPPKTFGHKDHKDHKDQSAAEP
jgi:hypothetical protein